MTPHLCRTTKTHVIPLKPSELCPCWTRSLGFSLPAPLSPTQDCITGCSPVHTQQTTLLKATSVQPAKPQTTHRTAQSQQQDVTYCPCSCSKEEEAHGWQEDVLLPGFSSVGGDVSELPFCRQLLAASFALLAEASGGVGRWGTSSKRVSLAQAAQKEEKFEALHKSISCTNHLFQVDSCLERSQTIIHNVRTNWC